MLPIIVGLADLGSGVCRMMDRQVHHRLLSLTSMSVSNPTGVPGLGLEHGLFLTSLSSTLSNDVVIIIDEYFHSDRQLRPPAGITGNSYRSLVFIFFCC